jgi:putative transposase
MMYVKFPLSLMFAAELRRKRVQAMRRHTHWRWHLDDVYVKIKGEMHYLWRAVDHEGEVLESFVTKARDKKAALKFIKKAMKRHGSANLHDRPIPSRSKI